MKYSNKCTSDKKVDAADTPCDVVRNARMHPFAETRKLIRHLISDPYRHKYSGDYGTHQKYLGHVQNGFQISNK